MTHTETVTAVVCANRTHTTFVVMAMTQFAAFIVIPTTQFPVTVQPNKWEGTQKFN